MSDKIAQRFLMITVVASSLACPWWAEAVQPPDVVQSDGSGNSAMGTNAMLNLTTGANNTAVGSQALQSETNGCCNTALGTNALYSNSFGYANTAVGDAALYFNSGNVNTASGYATLYYNTTGSYNSAFGVQALYQNTTGLSNLAVGSLAMALNTTGGFNTASGGGALYGNTTGSNNTAVGNGALTGNTSGSNNIALGYQAGYSLSTGNNNIDIGNFGVAGESGVIRIGSVTSHNEAFMAGIFNTKLSGLQVVVTKAGQLGVLASSERYKTGVASVRSVSERLAQLRPVSFHLRNDPDGPIQYGLIAEEVDRVLPELVIRGENGQVEGVRYDELAPLLLAELQNEKATRVALERAWEDRLAAQNRAIDALSSRLEELVLAVSVPAGDKHVDASEASEHWTRLGRATAR